MNTRRGEAERANDLLMSGVMVLGRVVELVLGNPRGAEGAGNRGLEAVARPLSLVPTTTVPGAAGATTAFSPDQRATA